MNKRWITIFVWLIAAAGCSQDPPTVSGTITLDGKPLKMAVDTRGTVVFRPTSGQGSIATGLLDADGNYQLATGSSLEVPAGNYEIAVSIVQLVPNAGSAEPMSERISPAKYASAGESGLRAEVTLGENTLNFDLKSDANAADPSAASVQALQSQGSVIQQDAGSEPDR